MKTDRIIRQSIILLICTMAVFVTLPALAWDQQAIDSADKFYRQGLTAYNMKHWSDAASNFEKSFHLIPHSMTAYMLSATYLESESPRKALRWADYAVSSKPKLEEPYVTGIREISDWARKSINDPYYTLTGKADGVNRPSKPHVKPPRPVLPQNSTLGIAPSTGTMAPPAPGNTMQPLIPAQPMPAGGQSDLQIKNVSIYPNPLVQSQVQLHMYRSYRMRVSIVNSGAPSPAFTVRTECNRNGMNYKLGETRVAPMASNQTIDAVYDIFPSSAGEGSCMMRTTVDADLQVNESDESPLSNSWDRAVTILP